MFWMVWEGPAPTGSLQEVPQERDLPFFYAMVSAIFLFNCHFIGLPAR